MSSKLQNIEEVSEIINQDEETNTDHEKSEYEEETQCGVCGVEPDWLQFLASKKTYVLVYGFLGMNQSALGSYFTGTLSTIEKRFKIPSTKTGLISCAWDIGALCSSMVMAYFGGRGHKTRWVAFGAVVAAISCFMRFLPHAIYGPGQDVVSTINLDSKNLCNGTRLDDEICVLENEGFTSFSILFLAHIALGVGTCTYYTLGVAYMDDNTLKNKIPFLFALATCMRAVGPTIGFIIAYYGLKRYINPEIEPSFDDTDPRWIGSWWIGWVPLGAVHLCFAFIMTCFPRTLPREAMRRKSAGAHWAKVKTKKSLQDFLETMKRLIKNPILMFNSFSTTFYIFGMIPYWTFMPKYIENQFRTSASDASFVTGFVGLVCYGAGVLVSGSVVSHFRPRPTYLAAWNVFTEAIDFVGHLLFAFLGCPKFDLEGQYNAEQMTWNLTTACNADCMCPESLTYNPVCASDLSATFYSPCHAGCLSSFTFNSTKIYTDCSCIPGGTATEGQCPIECKSQFQIFIILLCIMKFLAATGRAGNTIIQFRSVNPIDKSISIAMTEALLCVIAFIPGPIIYGSILDYSCLVWGTSCGKRGNCWVYDGKQQRYLLNFVASTFLLIATILDVGVLCNVGNLEIYDEEMKKKGETPDGTDNPLLIHNSNCTTVMLEKQNNYHSDYNNLHKDKQPSSESP